MADESKQEKESRPYRIRSQRMTDYIFREILEHRTSGSDVLTDPNIRRYIASYLEVHLSMSNEGIVSEDEARKKAHVINSMDLVKESY